MSEKPKNPKADFPRQRALVLFESGHYKTVTGEWEGDSVWTHFRKPDGGMVHLNKDKVEYIETWDASGAEKPADEGWALPPDQG